MSRRRGPRSRAALGAVAVAHGGWVWPHWLERQLDPSSPAFVPLGEVADLANVTARRWSAVGNVGSSSHAVVDPRGLVTPWHDGWSLDWWVGAEDRWHLPSREAAVRQRLVDAAPVVETAMRVPGGDIVHRAYAIRTAPADGARELVVVEIENATPVPVALALAVRPWNVEGVAPVATIGLHGSTPEHRRGASPTVVTVDGRLAVLLPKVPNRVAASTAEAGDVAEVVLRGDAGTAFPDDQRCPQGLASAAFVYPLAHRATLRVLLPLDPPPAPGRRARGLPRREPVALPAAPTAVPSAAQVANGWKAHAGRGLRLVLPDTRLAACVEASRRWLLLLQGGGELTSGPATAHRYDHRDAAALLGALGRFGYGAEVAEVLAGLAARQSGDGSFPATSGDPAATGAALAALGEHWHLTHARADVEGMAPVVAAAVEWIERRWAARSGGILAADDGSEAAAWSVRGVLDGAEVLAALGELDGAADARLRAKRLGADLDASLAGAAPLDACWPLGLLAPDDPRTATAAQAVRDRPATDRAVAGPAGLDPLRTLQLATVELATGDRRALDRLDWLLSVASPTWTWPEAVHPRLDAGSAGDGHHGPTTAGLLDLVRNLLVRETAEGGLALCSLVPDTWLGQQLEVHDAPTHHGTLSFAVRWHGDRPALLWELEPHDGASPVRITAPGLDPSWSTVELRGDALLAPVAPPAPPLGAGEQPLTGPATTDAAVVPPAPGASAATPVSLTRRRPRDGG